MPQVWQIAAGETGRDYTKLFLDYDLMFMGPGNPGAYYKHSYDALVEQGLVKKGIATQLRQFCTEINGNDIVLLRLGSQAKAIGWIRPWRAPGEYRWMSTFDDVFGWDLQHTRRVIWQHHLTDDLQKIQKSKGLFYYRGSAFSKVNRLEGQILELFKQCNPRDLKPLPSLPEPLTLEELGTELFSKGLPNEDVDKFILAIQRQRRLAKWYRAQSKKPAEHEVVAHMILPFMLALGWSEQLLAVEWNRIDLAAFSRTPRKKENVCLLCEAKEYGHGLQNKTFSHATNYIKRLKLDNCNGYGT